MKKRALLILLALMLLTAAPLAAAADMEANRFGRIECAASGAAQHMPAHGGNSLLSEPADATPKPASESNQPTESILLWVGICVGAVVIVVLAAALSRRKEGQTKK